VSPEPKKSNEFRRYRQFLTGLYLAAAACGVMLLVISVVFQLATRIEPEPSNVQISLSQPASGQLLHCHNKVSELYQELGKTTAQLVVQPANGKRPQIGAQWQEFSRNWKKDWKQADHICRFSEALKTHRGVAYGRLARVHHDLPTMHLKYQSLLIQFDKQQAAELVRMRRALDRSRTALVEAANREAR